MHNPCFSAPQNSPQKSLPKNPSTFPFHSHPPKDVLYVRLAHKCCWGKSAGRGRLVSIVQGFRWVRFGLWRWVGRLLEGCGRCRCGRTLGAFFGASVLVRPSVRDVLGWWRILCCSILLSRTSLPHPKIRTQQFPSAYPSVSCPTMPRAFDLDSQPTQTFQTGYGNRYISTISGAALIQSRNNLITRCRCSFALREMTVGRGLIRVIMCLDVKSWRWNAVGWELEWHRWSCDEEHVDGVSLSCSDSFWIPSFPPPVYISSIVAERFFPNKQFRSSYRSFTA